MDVVIICPGQGSQKPGMGRDLAEQFPAARQVFEEADAALGIPLTRIAFDGPESELTATAVAQPALLAHSMAAWAVVRDRLAPRVRAAAGHSLGEFTAHCVAGALSVPDALRLVRTRGELMQDSGTKRIGTMAAILGLSAAQVEEVCTTASTDGSVAVPANYNSPEQLVISGDVAAVERAMAVAKERGAKRAIRLNVSGAFHSPLMEVAAAGLARALQSMRLSADTFPVYANVTTEPVPSPAAASELLLRQLTSPVRWTALVEHIAAAVPSATWIELGTGSVLSGLVKRIVPGATTLTCGTVTDVQRLLEQLG